MADAPENTSEPEAPKEEAAPATVLERRWRKLDAYRDEEVEKFATRKVRTRGRRLYVISALMLGLAGMFAGMMTWIQPVVPPYFVPLFITEYQTPLVPVNSQGDPDRAALTGELYFPRIDPNSFSSQERHLFLQDLAGLRQRRADDALLLYISAFACTGPDERLYIYPADVVPDNTQTWLALETVLEYVRDCPSRHKLLVLDIMKPVAHVRLGVLENDASTRVPLEVERFLAKMEQDGLDPARLGLILTAASPGQVSYSSEALSRSVFNYYFEEALRGYAEGYDLARSEDGRVFVSEIFEFVRRRVDRWASSTRDGRQSPRLLGSGPDFAIVALDHGRALPYVGLPEAPVYPKWLLDGFKLRDKWEAEQLRALDPRLMNQYEGMLMRAENHWRGGVDPERVKNDLAESTGRFRALRDTARGLLPYPQPRSLALALFLGAQPDPALAQDLQDLWTKLQQQLPQLKPAEAPMARDKAIQDFVAKHKKATTFQIGYACFEVADVEANPTGPFLRFLEDIRAQFQAQPQFIETEFLRRLADLSTRIGDDNWPLSTVRSALDVVQKAESAVVDARVFPWVSGVLTDAMQLRYDAEVALFAPGYAPLRLAADRFARANDLFDLALAHEDSVRQAQQASDPAFDFLTRYIEILVTDPAMQGTWNDALTALGQLDELLAAPPAEPVKSPEAIRQQGEQIRLRTAALQQNLDRLRWTFLADHQAALIRQCNDPQATPAVGRIAQTIMVSPYLHAEDRQALWRAHLGLERRLAQQVLDRDADDDANRQLTPLLAAFDRQQARYQEHQRRNALVRGQATAALYTYAGLPVSERDKLREKLKQAANPQGDQAIHQAAQLIRTAWAELLPAALENNRKNLHAQDRISRVVPPFEQLELIDNPKSNPTVQLRVQEVNALFGWLEQFYRYRSRDLDGSPFYSDIAVEYHRRGPGLQTETSLLIDGCSSNSLTLAEPTTTCQLGVTLFTQPADQSKPTFRIITADDDWLDIKAITKELDKLAEPGAAIRTASVPLNISLKPGAELTRTPRPSGFLVEIALGTRVFHRRVSLSSLPPALADRLELALSTSPDGPAAPINELRLRPIDGAQKFYLFVRNPTAKPRKVSVQLFAGDQATANGSAIMDVKANSTEPVKFGVPAAPPAANVVKDAENAIAAAAQGNMPPAAPALPTFQGPLRWRLVDATQPDVILDEKVIPVGIASPREYVGVSSIRFWPQSPNTGRNLLEVRLRAQATPLPPPPCNVQLLLPADRIPGFISAKDGSFQGVIPPNGGQVLLYASNIQLAEGAAPGGVVYVQVDGQKRAFIFQVTFARTGEPTSPQEDDKPAVRLVAPKFARSSADFKVGIEVDNPPPGTTLELGLGQKVDGVFTPDLVEQLPTARQRFLGFNPVSKEGALLFQASDVDWDVKLDTSGVRGPRTLRARLLDANGIVVREALLDIVLDDSGPENVRFVQAPAAALLKGTVDVQATGQDPESGIAKVQFFWGRPIDGAMPPKIPTTDGTLTPMGDEQVWTAQVPIQGVLPGKNDLTVAFTNGVGLTSFATTTIGLTDGEPNKGPGKIVGVVSEGNRPQPGLTVSLFNTAKPTPPKQKPMPEAVAKTKADGSYEFDKLAPGKYSLSVAKEASGRVATASVEVPAGQSVTVNLSLLLP